MSKLLKIAFQELGQKEIKGDGHNGRILTYAKEAGFEWVSTDETPWCSIFLSWCAMKAELQRSKKANAKSWLEIGKKVHNPRTGDIVVFHRGHKSDWRGHVAIYLGHDQSGSKVSALGGNQSNSVSIGVYNDSKVAGYVRISEEVYYELPLPSLKKGSKGQEVKNLQLILKDNGFDCGAIDGDYGDKTASAVMSLQLKNSIIDSVIGEYGNEEYDTLHRLIGQ